MIDSSLSCEPVVVKATTTLATVRVRRLGRQRIQLRAIGDRPIEERHDHGGDWTLGARPQGPSSRSHTLWENSHTLPPLSDTRSDVPVAIVGHDFAMSLSD